MLRLYSCLGKLGQSNSNYWLSLGYSAFVLLSVAPDFFGGRRGGALREKIAAHPAPGDVL